MNSFKSMFEVDFRSLALFRFLMGLILVLDLIYRMAWVKAHYTDWGIFPRKFLVGGGLSEFRFSFHLISGRVEFQVILILLAIIFALSFMFGYRTKISGFVSWVLLLSIQNRAQGLNNAGDVIMKMMLFWSLFLPLAKVFSIDSALRTTKDKIKDYKYYSLPNVFFLLQLCMMYWVSIVTKNTPDWMKTQDAVYYALHIDQFAKPLAVWARQFVGLTRVFTFYTLFIEIAGPLFALTPFKWGWLRFISAALMINLHIGLFFTLEIGFFPWVCIVSWIAFFPTCFWELLEKVFQKRLSSKVNVYIDQDCGFCKKMARILKTFLILPSANITFAQENEETEKLMSENNSWIVETIEGKHLFHFDAFIHLTKHSPFLFWISPVLMLAPIHKIGTFTYKLVANNRMRFSVLTKHLKETKDFKEPSKFTKLFLLTAFIYIIVYILHALDIGYKLPPSVTSVGKTFSFTQKWSMFANPRKNDGWYVIKGTLKNNKEINVWTEEIGPVNFEKPESVSDQYINQRWRKYLGRLSKRAKKHHRKYFGGYLCRRWNDKHVGGEKLKKLKIYFVIERTPAPGGEFTTKKIKLRTHSCFKKKKKKKKRTSYL